MLITIEPRDLKLT